MNVCKHPNNVDNFKKKCKGKEKDNICYGENTDFKSLDSVDEFINNLHKDAKHYDKFRDIYTTGCWENTTGQPFLKDWKLLDEKDPMECIKGGNKWITGDGYVINKKGNGKYLEENTSKKIDVKCSPGYEGEPIIEIDSCNKYTSFKEGDNGEYEQFNLSGCNVCKNSYIGNTNVFDDKNCYPKCNSLDGQLFQDFNSNNNYTFIDTKRNFEQGIKRAGYCCNKIEKSILLSGIKGDELGEGTNILNCTTDRCEDGYVTDINNKYCCREIQNTKDDVKYICGVNSNNSEIVNYDGNYCKDGYYPGFNEEGNRDCLECDKTDGIHDGANVTCNIDGTNVKIKDNSEKKCIDDGLTYYDNENKICKKCDHNKELNKNYDMENNNSKLCECKGIYKEDNICIDCKSYKYMDYNPDYPEKNTSKCVCNIDEENLPENTEIGDCPDTLKEGETCNLKCKDGYKITGRQPMCFKSYFDIESFKCVKEGEEDNEVNTEKFDEPPIEGGEEAESNEETDRASDEEILEVTGRVITEGFMDISLNTKRLFLIFLLIILILNVV